ncbi:MAG: hypothetical protein EBX53_09890, partial [Betaproteobacteria bacterium]|nr:hypothetical protein [Betaproteobacteria bacterium]
MGLATLLAIGLDLIASRSHVLLQFALHVAVLYLFIGFRRFSSPFSAIQRAFSEGDASRAFVILQAWLRGRDLEDPADAAALENPMLALQSLRGLVVLDEVQRKPELFPILRVLMDRPGSPAKFLLLGSASPFLVKGVTESLAGRVSFIDL